MRKVSNEDPTDWWIICFDNLVAECIGPLSEANAYRSMARNSKNGRWDEVHLCKVVAIWDKKLP